MVKAQDSKMTSLDFQYLKSLLTPFQGRGGTFRKLNMICVVPAAVGGTFVSRDGA